MTSHHPCCLQPELPSSLGSLFSDGLSSSSSSSIVPVVPVVPLQPSQDTNHHHQQQQQQEQQQEQEQDDELLLTSSSFESLVAHHYQNKKNQGIVVRIPDAAIIPIVEKYIEFWFGRNVQQQRRCMSSSSSSRSSLLSSSSGNGHGNVDDGVNNDGVNNGNDDNDTHPSSHYYYYDTPLLEAVRTKNVTNVFMILLHRYVFHSDYHNNENHHHHHHHHQEESVIVEVDVNAQDQLGQTSLHLIIERICNTDNGEDEEDGNDDDDDDDDFTMLQLLFDKRNEVNVNIKDIYGKTPFHILAYYGFMEDDDTDDEESSSASSTTTMRKRKRRRKRKNIGQLLLQHGANINAQTEKVVDTNNNNNNNNDDDDGHRRGDGTTRSSNGVVGTSSSSSSVFPIGSTPLHIAIIENHISTISWLLQHGADCSIQDELGNTPLHHLVNQPKYHHQHQQHQKHQQQRHWTPGQESLLEQALVSCSTNSKSSEEIINIKDKDGWTILHYIANWKNILTIESYDHITKHTTNGLQTIIHILMKYGGTTSINSITNDLYGYTPLHIAAKNQDETMIQLLLITYKANVTMKDKWKEYTILHHLITMMNHHHHHDTGQRRSSGTTTTNRSLSLSSATAVARTTTTSTATNSGGGGYPNNDNKEVEVAIDDHFQKTIHLMRLVLHHGAHITATDVYGNTPLHLAARLGYTPLVQFLLSQIIGSGIVESSSRSSMTRSTSPTDLQHMVNCFDETPLHVAIRHGQESVTLQILIHDLAPNSHVNKHIRGNGCTALHLAVQAPLPSRTGLVRLCLKHGADANITDKVKTTGITTTKKKSTILSKTKTMMTTTSSRSRSPGQGGGDNNNGNEDEDDDGSNGSEKEGGSSSCINHEDDGDTPLHYFLQGPNKYKECPLIVHLLVERMNDVSGVIVRQTGESLLHCAAEWSEVSLLEYLVVERGLNLSSDMITDHRGWTPLHVAAYCGSEDTIRFLLQHGAKAATRTLNDEEPQTALEIATNHRFGEDRIDVLNLLQQYECRVQQFFVTPRIRIQPSSRRREQRHQRRPPRRGQEQEQEQPKGSTIVATRVAALTATAAATSTLPPPHPSPSFGNP